MFESLDQGLLSKLEFVVGAPFHVPADVIQPLRQLHERPWVRSGIPWADSFVRLCQLAAAKVLRRQPKRIINIAE
jgi:hypothetical protein